MHEISRLSGYARNTIRRVLCEKPSEPKSQNITTPRVKSVRRGRRRKMDVFEDYATRRLTQGRVNCVQLLDSLRQKGFSGSLAAVQKCVRRFRAEQLKGRLTCAIPYVPHDLPPWRLVYHYFSKWQKLGLWQKFNDSLRDKVRAKHGKKKPRLRASSTLRRLKWLTNPENAAMMLERRW